MNRVTARIFLVTAMAAGCAVQGAPFQKAAAPPGSATIYVYRPYHYEGSLLDPPVTCGEDTARIGPGGYHAFVVPAGKIVCSVPGGESSDETAIDAEARVYYLREEFGWGVLTGHPQLDPIDNDAAHEEIRRCCVDEAAVAAE
jgi:hypothetical protein